MTEQHDKIKDSRVERLQDSIEQTEKMIKEKSTILQYLNEQMKTSNDIDTKRALFKSVQELKAQEEFLNEILESETNTLNEIR